MEVTIKNLATINQVASILGCDPQTIRNAVGDKLTSVYPFPNKLNTKQRTGPQFILCDDKLSLYLVSQTFKAQKNLNKRNYDPVVEMKKHFEFING